MKKCLNFVVAVILAYSAMMLTACSDNTENTQSPSQKEMEKSIVGLWYEEFDYEDMTEDGKPFNHAMIVVETKADHTGYVALAVFDDEFNEPLKIYGGPNGAPFTWQMTAAGHVVLTDLQTRSTVVSAHTRGEGNQNSFVDIGQIDMHCTSGHISYSSTSHNGSLDKAEGNNNSLIQDWMGKPVSPTVSLC